jgi:hypothetical protein
MNSKIFGYCVLDENQANYIEKYYFIFAAVPRCGEFIKISKKEYEVVRVVHELNIEDNSPIIKVVIK